jgi:SapC
MTQTVHPPVGFKKLEALNKRAHRFALPREPSFAFCAQLNALPLTLSEFPVACRHYPIAFSSPDGIGDFGAVAVMGLKSAQNLFCGEDGKWREGVYVPAYVRCYPFCLATVIENGKTRRDKLVCIDAGAVVQDGVELFTERGDSTPAWREREKLLQEYESDVARTAGMCKALQGMGLFREFALQATTTTVDRELFNLTGMYRVDEAALAGLSLSQIRKLINQGWMEKIYAHLISLRNFQSLADGHGALPRRP